MFVAFGKAGKFSARELERCLDAKGKWPHRSIVLSQEELEPYLLFDLADIPDHLRHASSVQGLADISEARYRPRIDGSA